jgi:hypothetical protein
LTMMTVKTSILGCPAAMRMWNQGTIRWKTSTLSGECSRVQLCGMKPQTKWSRCSSLSSGWTWTMQLADSHRSILESVIRITTNSNVINIGALGFMTQYSLVLIDINSTKSVQISIYVI